MHDRCAGIGRLILGHPHTVRASGNAGGGAAEYGVASQTAEMVCSPFEGTLCDKNPPPPPPPPRVLWNMSALCLAPQTCQYATPRAAQAPAESREAIQTYQAVPEYPLAPPPASSSAAGGGGLSPFIWIAVGFAIAKGYDFVRPCAIASLPAVRGGCRSLLEHPHKHQRWLLCTRWCCVSGTPQQCR